MAKVIIVSRFFPAYHPRKREPTFFVEKVWESLGIVPEDNPELCESDFDLENEYEPKNHTIRAGNRWKVGDKASLRVWSGKPYRSKQIIIAPDVEVVRTYQFDKDKKSLEYYLNDNLLFVDDLKVISKNDGLSLDDFFGWFNKPFSGQIISWSDKISY